jgi:hypothetical protein
VLIPSRQSLGRLSSNVNALNRHVESVLPGKFEGVSKLWSGFERAMRDEHPSSAEDGEHRPSGGQNGDAPAAELGHYQLPPGVAPGGGRIFAGNAS